MAGDDSAGDGALITGRDHDEHTRRAAWSSASPSARSPLEDDCVRARLKFRMRTPASMQARIAAVRSSGVALGISALPDAVSAKMGYASNVQLGQRAGAGVPRLAHKIPATNVPCRQAALL